jgi:hypothetical protein
MNKTECFGSEYDRIVESIHKYHEKQRTFIEENFDAIIQNTPFELLNEPFDDCFDKYQEIKNGNLNYNSPHHHHYDQEGEEEEEEDEANKT